MQFVWKDFLLLVASGIISWCISKYFYKKSISDNTKLQLEPILENIDKCLKVQSVPDNKLYEELNSYVATCKAINNDIKNLSIKIRNKLNFREKDWYEFDKRKLISADNNDLQYYIMTRDNIIKLIIPLKEKIKSLLE